LSRARRIAAVVTLGLSCVSGVALASATSLLEIYRTGNYEAAITAAESEGTGEALAVAARAAFAEANLSETPCMPCLKRVEALSRRSIALDMGHPDAYVYLAAALGYQARIIGMVRAELAHYPELAKDAIEHALAVAPNDSWSLAAMGAWHIEVVRNGGSLIGRTIYGARADSGLQYFRRAIAAEPENPVIRMQFVLTVSGYDFDANRDEVLTQLNAAATLEPRSAYERAMRERAMRLLELARANKRADYLKLISRYQGYT
jgi:hypothetical protein